MKITINAEFDSIEEAKKFILGNGNQTNTTQNTSFTPKFSSEKLEEKVKDLKRHKLGEKRAWTEFEEEWIYTHYNHTSARILAKALQRSIAQVTAKIFVMQKAGILPKKNVNAPSKPKIIQNNG